MKATQVSLRRGRATVEAQALDRYAAGLDDQAADAQILPMSSRTSTIRSISPTPPLGP